MEKELADIVRRLQPNWPGVDVASFVATAYQRLAEEARVTMYLPLLTEHLTRTWLKEERAQDLSAASSVESLEASFASSIGPSVRR